MLQVTKVNYPVPGYRVNVTSGVHTTTGFFAHTRRGEVEYAAFCEKHRDYHNRKPYRKKEGKRKARENAVRVNGRFVSSEPRQYH